MRKVRIRELLLVVALVALGLGWAIDHAGLARDSYEDLHHQLLDNEYRELDLRSQVRELERTLAEERRRLAECEANQAEGED